MVTLDVFLQHTAALHRHLCPRQVLGVRMGMYAGELLRLTLPQQNKRLFALVELDGCFADGVMAATGCSLGHRTMRLVDYGKAACTFVDTQTGRAVRIAPHREARARALACMPNAKSRWHAQLEAYQTLPNDTLLVWQEVSLTFSLDALISRPGVRVTCDACGEEITNEREVRRDGQVLCRACAGESYYTVCDEARENIVE